MSEILKKLSDEIDKEQEIPYKVDWEFGKKPTGLEFPPKIEEISTELKSVAEKLDYLVGEKKKVEVTINEAKARLKDEIKMPSEQLADFEKQIQDQGQKILTAVQDNVEEKLLTYKNSIIAIIDKVERTPEPIKDEWKLKKVLEIIKNLGVSVDKVEEELEKAIRGATRYKETEVKKILKFPDKRSSVKIADVLTSIKTFFVSIWNNLQDLFSSVNSVGERISELEAIL